VLERPDLNIALVQFVDGARTHWHTHPEEQVLVVLEGDCRLRTRSGEERTARQGQTVHLPAGEEHWHGAVPGTTMTHLSVTTGGAAVWGEPAE
jgi:quercetin dioxygenase-like cupin family protein